MSEALRDQIIQVLLSTRAMSEGDTADALLNLLAAQPPAQAEPPKSLLRKPGEKLVCYCPPGICQAPKGFRGPCNRAQPEPSPDTDRIDARRYRAFRKAQLPNGLGVYDEELDAKCDELADEQEQDGVASDMGIPISGDTEQLVTDGGRNMFYEGLFEGETDSDRQKRLATAYRGELEYARISLRDARLNLADAENEIANLRESLAHADKRATDAEEFNERMKLEIQGPTFMGEPVLRDTEQQRRDAVAYRLLASGETISAGDEVLSDDAVNWLPLDGVSIGLTYRPGMMSVRRRIDAAAAIEAEGKANA